MLVIVWGSPAKSHEDGRNLPIAFGTSGITGVALQRFAGSSFRSATSACRASSPRPLKWRCATCPVTLMQPTLLPRPIHHAGGPETDETKRDEASRSLALARSLHLFQRLASCLTYEGPHERQGERGGHGVKPVGTGETDRIQQWQEGDGDGEVRHPVGAPDT